MRKNTRRPNKRQFKSLPGKPTWEKEQLHKMEKRHGDICGLSSVITAPHSTLAETRKNWTQSPTRDDRLHAAFPVWLTGGTVAEQVAFQHPHAPLRLRSSALGEVTSVTKEDCIGRNNSAAVKKTFV